MNKDGSAPPAPAPAFVPKFNEEPYFVDVAETLVLHLNASELGGAGYWQLVQWCQAQGADEFSVGVIGMDGTLEPRAQRTFDVLAPYRRGDARRERFALLSQTRFELQEADMLLWSLQPESIDCLRALEQLPANVAPGTASPLDFVDLWDLHLYRDARLMLAFDTMNSVGIVRIRAAEQDAFRTLAIRVHEKPYPS